jgi:hypothetical protein
MSHSSTLFGGMDVHKDSIAVVYVAQEHGAESMELGAMGTHPCNLDQLIRKLPSKATHLSCVYEYWRAHGLSPAIQETPGGPWWHTVGTPCYA